MASVVKEPELAAAAEKQVVGSRNCQKIWEKNPIRSTKNPFPRRKEIRFVRKIHFLRIDTLFSAPDASRDRIITFAIRTQDFSGGFSANPWAIELLRPAKDFYHDQKVFSSPKRLLASRLESFVKINLDVFWRRQYIAPPVNEAGT